MNSLKILSWAIYLGCILVATACQKHLPESKEQILAYVNDSTNGLLKTAKSGIYSVSVAYQPRGLAPACPACTNYLYFTIKIAVLPTAGTTQFLDSHAFPESIETFAFRMGDYVKLVTHHDTITAADYTFQRTFGLDKQGSFLFVFPEKVLASTRNFTLLINKNGLIAKPMLFSFNPEDIKRTQNFPVL